MPTDRDGTCRRSALAIGPRLESALRVAYRARRAVLLEGPSGIGKSEIVIQVARSLGIDWRVLDLSLMEPPDLIGLPVLADGVSSWARPAILPDSGAGLLVLEELNRAERYVQHPALQLLSARRLHEYVLPDDWSIVAAINPESGDYQVTSLDPALRSRFLQLRVRADRDAWIAWARRNRVHPAVVRVALLHDRLLEEVAPRTWTYVSDVLRALALEVADDERLLRDLLGGYLPGPWVESVIVARRRIDEAVDLSAYRLLAGYANDADAQKRLADLLKQGRTDLIAGVAHQVESVFLDEAEVSALVARGEIDLDSFERLLDDLPGDHAEKLQKAFGNSCAAASLTGIEPERVVNGYRGSAAAQTVDSWLAVRRKRHRAWALATGVRSLVERLPPTDDLRRSAAIRDGLACFLEQLGAAHGAPLRRTVRRKGIALRR